MKVISELIFPKETLRKNQEDLLASCYWRSSTPGRFGPSWNLHAPYASTPPTPFEPKVVHVRLMINLRLCMLV